MHLIPLMVCLIAALVLAGIWHRGITRTYEPSRPGDKPDSTH